MSIAYTSPACVTAPRTKLETSLCRLADAGPSAIADRLGQLDREWSAGRVTRAILAVAVLSGLVLGFVAHPYWFALPAAAGLLLFQYLFSRTCLLTAVAVAMGFRPGSEIDEEKFALKALRGDFRHLPTVHEVASDPDALTRLEGEGGPAFDDDTPRVAPHHAVQQVLDAARR